MIAMHVDVRKVLATGVWLLAACAGDDDLDVGSDPAQVNCPCRLRTSIENLAVCVAAPTLGEGAHVYSSSWAEGAAAPTCERRQTPQPAPADPWSRVRVRSACTGTGELCVTVRARSGGERSPDDCVLATRCSPFGYPVAEAEAELPPLGSWVDSSECAQRYDQYGGYLEFALTSDALGCNMGGTQITTTDICPVRCQQEPNAAGCEICGAPQVAIGF